jgi:uncharacterized protein (DUF169 family)
MANAMTDRRSLLRLAEALLDLERDPVGILRLSDRSDRSDRSKAERLGAAPPHTALYFCSAVTLASKGKSFTLYREHVRCPAARRVLGYEEVSEAEELACEYASYGTYENEDVARAVIVEQTARIDGETHGVTQALTLAPLSRYFEQGLEPDAATFVSSPYAIMRLIQGYAYSHGAVDSLSVAGMHGMCSESFARAYVAQGPSVSFLCSGARHFGMFGEKELAITFPGKALESVLQGVAATADVCEDDARKERIARRLAASGIDFPLTYRGSYIYRE